MAVFNFRLAQVLRLQQAIEDMEKRELQLRLATLARTELALAQAQAQRASFAGRLEQVEAAGLPAAELVTRRRWHPVLVAQVTKKEQDTAQALEATDKQRQQVQLARLERRTLEQLLKRQKSIFDQDQEQREQVMLDELAVQRWPNEERL